jgi:protein prenyltransferase alpha subunit repeat containing protein 1
MQCHQPCSDTTIVDLCSSSVVILLANPGHQTALNTRKRLIQQGRLDAQQELTIIAAMLGGVRDCSKQSILWHHRQWLFHHLNGKDIHPQSARGSGDLAFHIPVHVLQNEFDIISPACELYPRNYYAWSHWQFCLRALVESITASNLPTSDDLSERALLILREYGRLRRWIECHISDHTAVHHLCMLVLCIHDPNLRKVLSTTPSSGKDTGGVVDPVACLDHARSLVISYPDHETLWMYLRGAFHLRGHKDYPEVLSTVTHNALELPQYAYQFYIWCGIQVFLSLCAH